MRADRQFIAACRHLVQDYGPVLEAIKQEVEAEAAVPLTGPDAFTIAQKAIRQQSIKEAMTMFISKLKHYGNQRAE